MFGLTNPIIFYFSDQRIFGLETFRINGMAPQILPVHTEPSFTYWAKFYKPKQDRNSGTIPGANYLQKTSVWQPFSPDFSWKRVSQPTLASVVICCCFFCFSLLFSLFSCCIYFIWYFSLLLNCFCCILHRTIINFADNYTEMIMIIIHLITSFKRVAVALILSALGL